MQDHNRSRITKRLNSLSGQRSLKMLASGLLVIAVILFFAGRRSETSYSFDFGENTMTMKGPEGTEPIAINYIDISSVELIQNFSYGSAESGISDDHLYYGTRRNESLGSYTICADPRISNVISVQADSSYYVFNYESEQVTERLLPALNELLAEK